MHARYPEKLEAGRIRQGSMASRPGERCGMFVIWGPCSAELVIVASDGGGWEHVSVSTKRRPPNWQEMCFVKDLFWADYEWVVQYHPAKTDYVNLHPYTLHLWCPTTTSLPTPPSWMVGPKDLNDLSDEEKFKVISLHQRGKLT